MNLLCVCLEPSGPAWQTRVLPLLCPRCSEKEQKYHPERARLSGLELSPHQHYIWQAGAWLGVRPLTGSLTLGWRHVKSPHRPQGKTGLLSLMCLELNAAARGWQSQRNQGKVPELSSNRGGFISPIRPEERHCSLTHICAYTSADSLRKTETLLPLHTHREQPNLERHQPIINYQRPTLKQTVMIEHKHK